MANNSEYVIRGQEQAQRQETEGWTTVEKQDSTYHSEYERHMQMDERVRNSIREGKEDSESMQRVKQAMTQLTEALHGEIAADPKVFKTQMSNISKLYLILIDACQTYQNGHRINFSSAGRERSRMVAEVKARASEERMHFADVGSAMQLHKNRVEGMILGNVLGGMLTAYRSVKVGFEVGLCEDAGDYLYSDLEDEETGEQWDAYFEKKKETLGSQFREDVSMSRMMEFLGVGNLCQKSEVALAKDARGNRFFGVRREKLRYSEDMTYDQLVEKVQNENNSSRQSNNGIEFSAKALRELSVLQLMRMLAGAQDPNSKEGVRLSYTEKHIGNGTMYVVTGVYLEPGQELFTTVKPNQYEQKDAYGKTLKAIDLPVIDTETAAAILAMRAEDFKFLTADMLSKNQQEAFGARLVWLQSQLADRISADMDKPENERGAYRATDWENQKIRSNLWVKCRDAGNLFPDMINIHNAYEDASNAFSSLSEGYYNDIQAMLKDKIKAAPSPKEALWILMRFSLGVDVGMLNDITAHGKEVGEDVRKRLVGELLSEDLLKAYVRERYDALKRIKDAYDQVAQQPVEVPQEFYDQAKIDQEITTRVTMMRIDAREKNEPFDEEVAKQKATARVQQKIEQQYRLYLLQKDNQKLATDMAAITSFANAFYDLAFQNMTGNSKMNSPTAVVKKLSEFFGKKIPGGYDVFAETSAQGSELFDIMGKFDLLNKNAVKDVVDAMDEAATLQGRNDLKGVLPEDEQSN